MYLEGIVSLPRDEADVDRFEAEVRTAKRAGATIVRTVMLCGPAVRDVRLRRRVPQVRRRRPPHSLALAAPVVARHGVRLAVENHKDWRADELVALLKRLGSDHVGVCLDTGNSIALLEDPMEVVEALAPLGVHDPLQGHGRRGIRATASCSPRSRSATGSSTCPAIVRTLRDGQPGDPLQPGDDHPRPARRSPA